MIFLGLTMTISFFVLTFYAIVQTISLHDVNEFLASLGTYNYVWYRSKK